MAKEFGHASIYNGSAALNCSAISLYWKSAVPVSKFPGTVSQMQTMGWLLISHHYIHHPILQHFCKGLYMREEESMLMKFAWIKASKTHVGMRLLSDTHNEVIM